VGSSRWGRKDGVQILAQIPCNQLSESGKIRMVLYLWVRVRGEPVPADQALRGGWLGANVK